MGQELVQEAVGAFQFEDAVGGQQWGEAFLPVVVPAFDFAFGLGCGGVAQRDAVEVKGRAQLSEGVGVVGVEEGVVVHVEGQWEAVGLEGTGQEVQVGQEGFAGVEPCAGVVAGGIIEEVEQNLLVSGVGEEGVRCGVILPEGAVIAGLPALDGFADLFVAGVGGQLVFKGPAADAGAVGFEVKAAVQFAGGSAVGGRRLGGEKVGQQDDDLGGPVRVMIAAGAAGRPSASLALGADEQVVNAQLVKAAEMNLEFQGRSLGREAASTDFSEEVADQRGGQTMDQLLFFMAVKVVKRWIFRFETDSGRG